MISMPQWLILPPRVFGFWASPPSELPDPMRGRRGFIFFRRGACSLSWSASPTARGTRRTLRRVCGIRPSLRSDEALLQVRVVAHGVKALEEFRFRPMYAGTNMGHPSRIIDRV